MREMSVTEQRYKAVLAVIANGRTVSEVASEWGVCRQTMHRWLARYEGDGLEGLGNRSSRPAHCPHQTPPEVEAVVLEMRRAHPYWGARRIAFELARKGLQPSPSEPAVYRCLVRRATAGDLCGPAQRRFDALPSKDALDAFRAPRPPLREAFDAGNVPAETTDCQGPPDRRPHSAPTSGASSADTRPTRLPPRSPSDHWRLPPEPLCTFAQSRSSP